jgi:hypothetical protein
MGREADTGRIWKNSTFLTIRRTKDRGELSPRLSSTGRIPPALAFVGPLAPSTRIPRGWGRGSRCFDTRFAARGLAAWPRCGYKPL